MTYIVEDDPSSNSLIRWVPGFNRWLGGEALLKRCQTAVR